MPKLKPGSRSTTGFRVTEQKGRPGARLPHRRRPRQLQRYLRVLESRAEIFGERVVDLGSCCRASAFRELDLLVTRVETMPERQPPQVSIRATSGITLAPCHTMPLLRDSHSRSSHNAYGPLFLWGFQSKENGCALT